MSPVEVHSIFTKSRMGHWEHSPAPCVCLGVEKGERRQEGGQRFELQLNELWLHGDFIHCLHLMFATSIVFMDVFTVLFRQTRLISYWYFFKGVKSYAKKSLKQSWFWKAFISSIRKQELYCDTLKKATKVRPVGWKENSEGEAFSTFTNRNETTATLKICLDESIFFHPYFFLHIHFITKIICPHTVCLDKMAKSQNSYIQGLSIGY